MTLPSVVPVFYSTIHTHTYLTFSVIQYVNLWESFNTFKSNWRSQNHKENATYTQSISTPLFLYKSGAE